MRVRWPVAGVFAVVFLIAAYLGFTPHPTSPVNDKLLHFLVFFFLTLLFYWIIDTTKRRILNMTIVFSLVVDIASEVMQAVITNRPFDLIDIIANLLGSACALGLNILYHKRHIARKQAQNRYAQVPSTATGDLEMAGEQVTSGDLQSGIVEGDLGTAK